MNKKIVILLGLSFYFNLSQLFSQSTYYVDEVNLDAMVDQIFEIHGDVIDETYDNVHYFLELLLQGTGEGSCSPPVPTIQSMDNNEVNFSWPAVPNATNYDIAYLKLNQLGQGSGGFFSTNLTNINITVANGLLLFAFKSECIITPSKLTIIIVDKPAFIVDEEGTCDCATSTEQLFSFPPVDGDEDLILERTHEGIFGVYKGVLTYTDIDLVSEFMIRIDETYGTLHIMKAPACMTNFTDDGSVMYSVDEDGDDVGIGLYLANVYFNEGFELIYGEHTGIFSIKECTFGSGSEKGVGKKKGQSFNRLQVSPNPAQSRVRVHLPEYLESQAADLSIVDAYGQALQNQSIADIQSGDTIRLNVEALSPGIYYVVLKLETGTLQTKFIKI